MLEKLREIILSAFARRERADEVISAAAAFYTTLMEVCLYISTASALLKLQMNCGNDGLKAKF